MCVCQLSSIHAYDALVLFCLQCAHICALYVKTKTKNKLNIVGIIMTIGK